jgi:DNA helicase-2/ATP-dependent DNA helicase PcrA
MTSQEYEVEYLRPNKAQKEAVDTIEGPVMVAAGPGTGKTQILALRIANILQKTDMKPENILAITFTESGVFSMRKRLRNIIGNSAYRVAISTFHGFCNDIIINRPEDFPTIIGSVNITEVDQIRVLEEVFSELKLEKLTTFSDPFYYLKSAKSAIGQLKQEGVSPDKFEIELAKIEKEFWLIEDLYSTKKGYEGKLKGKYADELKRIEKNKELVLVYRAYEQKMRENKYYDFTDMIMQTLEALKKDKDLLLSLQENFQYILVDEHQDTNNAQNGVLELLASFYDEPNLFVVGDEKQAIFRFQGASLENFLYFKNKYPGAKFIVLEENYRSTQMILDSAHSLLSCRATVSPGKLLARAGHSEEKIKIFEFPKQEAEEYFVAKSISEKIADGVKPEDIAVIYRENRDAFSVGAMLEKMGVAYSIESNQDLLDDSEVKKLVMILRAVNEFGDSEKFIETLHIDFVGIEAFDIFKFAQIVAKEKVNAYEAGKQLHFLEKAGIESAEKIHAWYLKLAEFNQLASSGSASVVFETIVRESGLLPAILSNSDNVEKIAKVNALFDEVQSLIEKKRSAKLADFMEHLEMLDKHEIRLKRNSEGAKPGRVRLMTAHGSKGLEFEQVYLVYANDKHWGNKSHRDLIKVPGKIFSLMGDSVAETDENDDERRLFYVALTRAKKSITISYSRQGTNSKEMLPSMFLDEMDKELWEKADGKKYEEEYSANVGLRYAPKKTVGVNLKDKDFVRELFTSRGFAVTHLNNYLTCPWRYFYMNLLRLPKAQELHLMYGTAIHAALCDFFEQFKENDNPTKEFLIAAFERSLALQPITAGDYELCLKRGEQALAGYFEEHKGHWRTNVLTEFDVKGIMLTPEILLTGKIDKIEFLGDGGEVNVVDYKTGKPKSRGKIEGKDDEESEGGIKRQLAFYNLLLDKYDNGKYKMVSGDIDFVEPNASGKYKKESFVVTKKDVEELEELIKRVADEIVNLKFWDKRCGEKNCEFCELREMIK